MLQKYKGPLVLIGVILVVLFGYMLYANSQYRITRITPNNRQYPNSLGVMEIYFNKKLDKDALNAVAREEPGKIVQGSFEGGINVVAHDDHLTLTFVRTPADGDYEIELKDVKAVGGATLSKTIPLNVKDIPYVKMNKEERAFFDKATAGADDHSLEYPLLAKLPHETDKYLIDYRLVEGDPAPTVVITMKFFAPGSIAVPATQQEMDAYLADLRTYRNQALAWLRSQAPDLETNYTLEYTELELDNEFPKGRGRYHNENAEPGESEHAPDV